MKYYKAKCDMYFDFYPFIVPKDSLFTENEFKRFRLDKEKHFFSPVEISKKHTEIIWYQFRFEKEVK